MNPIKEHIGSLFSAALHIPAENIVKLPQSGGDRIYFRIYSKKGNFIATYNENIRENETFFYFTDIFHSVKAPVPRLFAISEDRRYYIQEDLGEKSLLDELESQGPSDDVMELYRKTLSALASLQIQADKKLNYEHCITSREFGKQAILNDLLYFKYYFLDTLKIPYDKENLMADFEALSNYLSHAHERHFMFRDFQARNVMVKDGVVYFIDYQGGMKGALQYDAASLLWQAKANLSESWKDALLEYYMECIARLQEKPLDRISFIGQFNGYVLIRLLQVLGAYGFRGLFERKAHFLTSIPLALQNLRSFSSNRKAGLSLPELERILSRIAQDDIIARFQTKKADASTPLVVRINSFSYIKTGYPADDSEHGGGFIFDCRGILNPGRKDEYKSLTGRDAGVKEYLANETRMDEFLLHVYNTVDIAVENYMDRDFPYLSVSFGCTGGQHRSVYAADALARHLRNKYGVAIELHHIEQNIIEKKQVAQ
jgi:aminoglycoside/choline kinase family phosphotransferase